MGVLLTPVEELSSAIAPTTTVSPLMATEKPKWSPACPPGPTAAGFRYACWLHTPPLWLNTYAAPAEPAANSFGVLLTPNEELSSWGAPTTTVFPLTATE